MICSIQYANLVYGVFVLFSRIAASILTVIKKGHLLKIVHFQYNCVLLNTNQLCIALGLVEFHFKSLFYPLISSQIVLIFLPSTMKQFSSTLCALTAYLQYIFITAINLGLGYIYLHFLLRCVPTASQCIRWIIIRTLSSFFSDHSLVGKFMCRLSLSCCMTHFLLKLWPGIFPLEFSGIIWTSLVCQ